MLSVLYACPRIGTGYICCLIYCVHLCILLLMTAILMSLCESCGLTCRKLMDIIRAQEQSRELHEQFHHQLERAQDGFSVIADYYGRSVFNKVLCNCTAYLLSLIDVIELVN